MVVVALVPPVVVAPPEAEDVLVPPVDCDDVVPPAVTTVLAPPELVLERLVVPPFADELAPPRAVPTEVPPVVGDVGVDPPSSLHPASSAALLTNAQLTTRHLMLDWFIGNTPSRPGFAS